MQGDYYRIVTAALVLALIVVVPLAAWLGLRAGRKRGSAERALPRFGASYPSEPAVDTLRRSSWRPSWLGEAMDGAPVQCIGVTHGEARHFGMVTAFQASPTVLVVNSSGRGVRWPATAVMPDPHGGRFNPQEVGKAVRRWSKLEDDLEGLLMLRPSGALPVGCRTAIASPHSLKTVGEALSAAQSSPLTGSQRLVISALLADIHAQRPIDADGVHTGRELCTPWCQCETPRQKG